MRWKNRLPDAFEAVPFRFSVYIDLRSLIDYNFIRWEVIGAGISHIINVGIAHFFHMSAAPWIVRIEDVRSGLPWK
jgi:hypothetical protein